MLLWALDEVCAEVGCPADADALRIGMAGEGPPGATRGDEDVFADSRDTLESVRESETSVVSLLM